MQRELGSTKERDERDEIEENNNIEENYGTEENVQLNLSNINEPQLEESETHLPNNISIQSNENPQNTPLNLIVSSNSIQNSMENVGNSRKIFNKNPFNLFKSLGNNTNKLNDNNSNHISSNRLENSNEKKRRRLIPSTVLMLFSSSDIFRNKLLQLDSTNINDTNENSINLENNNFRISDSVSNSRIFKYLSNIQNFFSSRRNIYGLNEPASTKVIPFQLPHLLSRIFRFLDFDTLCVCRRVSKVWNIALFENASVRQLDLTRETNLDAWMEGRVIPLRRVKHFTVNNSYISENQIFTGLKHELGFKLAYLNFSGCYLIYDAGIKEILRLCPTVETLILDRCDGIYGTFIDESFSKLTNLKELSVNRCFSLQKIEITMLPSSLKVLRLNHSSCTDYTFFQNLFLKLKEIRSIDISSCSIRLNNLVTPFILPTTCQSINISGQYTSIAFKMHFSCFYHLKRLILRDYNQISWIYNNLLYETSQNIFPLELLDISFSQLLKESPPMENLIKFLKCFPDLRVLTLLGWTINSKLAYYLTHSQICPSLEILSVGKVEDSRSFSHLLQSNQLHYLFIENITESELNICKEQIAASKRKIDIICLENTFGNEFGMLNDPLETFNEDEYRIVLKDIPISEHIEKVNSNKCRIM